MAFTDDLPPQLAKDVKRRSKKRRSVKSKDVEVLVSVATRAAHIARDKGFHVVSPEAIRCVDVLRMMRSMPLTPRLITKTNVLRSLQFLATNGNPKIRSESKSVLYHLKGVLASS
ncbi:Transcription elongation factor (TFIIS) family protein [Raphanus sativus]|uniref:Uncharacterized protein LOC108841445 n=1 Tax=Raphanus sativus TaxID=3726 RepID=A0A6J0MCL5_RAPSA|nr:uncharacterized protein LOC108841445 [Raphanus sativus]KAJ4910593.1 Transcription elongation factor (TFIIS) family protein [Raphanus sativus]